MNNWKSRINSGSVPMEDATANEIPKTIFSALSLSVTTTKTCLPQKYKSVSRSHLKRVVHQKMWTKPCPCQPSTSKLSSLIIFSPAFSEPIYSTKIQPSVTAVQGNQSWITVASTTASTGWTRALDLIKLTLEKDSHQTGWVRRRQTHMIRSSYLRRTS